MRVLHENLSLKLRPVNLATQTQLRQAIRTFVMLTSGRQLGRAQVGLTSCRAKAYVRRLQLLASGSPRAMNFALRWCCNLHHLSELPPVGTLARKQARAAWREMWALVKDVVEQIRHEIENSR